ncbi:MAG: hemerythrin domain-containing protein [Proteobacteria bacterium]|nr:hemerythrin domain-containing protein [Pseudomonadota bacterium]
MAQGFVVRPFAFMRLTHEGIRAGLAEVGAALETLEAEPNLAHRQSLHDTMEALCRVIHVHADIEEDGFFPLLDSQFANAAGNAGFAKEHVEEDACHDRVRAAIEGLADPTDASARGVLREAVAVWLASCEAHLLHEEEVMMPLTQKVHATQEGRAAAVGKIIASVPEEQVDGTLLPYVLERLEKTKPFGPLRMFVEATRMSMGPDRFARAAPVVRTHLSAEAVGKLESLGSL